MPVDQERLHRTLNPRSIVVVGDKGPNYTWLSSQKDFDGPVYSVQVDPNEVKNIVERGFTNFSSLADVPGDIDLVIVAVPRQIAPRIVADAVARGVGGMSMYTAGFAETHEEIGIQLQDKIVEIATAGGMPIVGPNCLGIYNRRLGVKFNNGQIKGEGGNIAFVSQSGSVAGALTNEAQAAGLEVTRTISCGNACVVSEADYLEYLANDPDTQYIGLYLEGMQEGRRFFQQLREVTKRKPVVIFKGGSNPVGQQATDSHTGSLATPVPVWEAMVRQAGAISVATREELIDTLVALVRMPPATGRRMALLASTGGSSVAIADAAGRADLAAPVLSDRSYEALGEFFVTVGGSYRNPFDMGSTVRGSGEALGRILEIIGADPAIDGAIYDFGPRMDPKQLPETADTIAKFRDAWGKPVLMAAYPTTDAEANQRTKQTLVERQFAVFPSFDRAAQAYARATAYYANRADRG